MTEPILNSNQNRFTLFPLNHKTIWNLYKTAQNSYWVAEELDLSTDLIDWNEKLNDDERHYLKHILAFFAQSDGIVNENLLERFEQEVQYIEAKYFYRFQGMMENIHAEAYAIFIDTYISDPDEKKTLFNAIHVIPCVKKKADWALRWITCSQSFGERLLAFACVEGIFFSGSFAAIFWMRKRGLLKGLSQGNTLISRDEGLHQRFACMIYRDHLSESKPNTRDAQDIVRSACEIEKNFQTEAMSVSLIGMNPSQMCQYIEYVADFLLDMINVPKIYKSSNPFDFMELISLDTCENFFEGKAVNYSIGMSEKVFSTEEEF
jgi:ribonucleoside-diphosphate reductase beta chain